MKCRNCGSYEGSFWKAGLCDLCIQKQRDNNLMNWLSEHKNKNLFDLKKYGDKKNPQLQYLIVRLDNNKLQELEKNLKLKIEIQRIKKKEEDRKIREEAENKVYGKVQTTRIPLTEKDKDIIFKIFNNECSICGKKEGLHIHHKNENATDNRINNLTILCGVCHKKIHMKVR